MLNYSKHLLIYMILEYQMTSEIITKKCKKCHTIKDVSEFSFANILKNLYQTWCKECMREYYAKNKEKIKKDSDEYYKKNKHKIKEYYKIYGVKYRGIDKNKDNKKKYQQRWNSTEVGIISKCNRNHKRRDFKIKNNDGTLPINTNYPLSKELENLLVKQNHKCAYCGSSLVKYKHLDHIIPLSKGGNHSIKNVEWLCPSCNFKKGSRLPE